jgi:fermentation-respiration switch protein FrsA (DUF1100 family)
MIFLYVLFFAYLVLLVLMVVFQRKLMYLPDKAVKEPESYGLVGFQDLSIHSSDGTHLQFWYRAAANGMPTVQYFHGNAFNLGHRVGHFAALAEKGFGVAAVSFRGYGKSDGRPNEKGIYEDARAAVQFLTDLQKIPLKKIMFFGESLGTGVAIQMATEFDVGALILQAAYTSVATRAAQIYFYIPVQLLIRDRYDSIKKIARVKAPLLLFHGERDRTIPIVQGKTIFEAAVSPKQAFYFPDRSHNDFDSKVISEHVLDFAKEYHLIDA